MRALTPALAGPADIDDDATRRRFLQLIGAAGLLAGCASDSDEAGAAPTPTGAPTREFTDRLGRKVTVPVDPQRVVVLDPARALVDALALGIIPIGSTTAASNGGNGFPALAGAAGARLASVGELGMADLERIKALSPDLILFATIWQRRSR